MTSPQREPHTPFEVLSVERRRPVVKDDNNDWVIEPSSQTPSNNLLLNTEMKQMKQQWANKHKHNTETSVRVVN